jgi:type IV pilus assembly protein PilE
MDSFKRKLESAEHGTCGQRIVARYSAGFTLLELMVTMVVIAILAAIAIPSYSEHIMRGKITEATTNLSDMRVKLEQYFQDNRTYVGACAAGTLAPLPTGANAVHFTYTCPTLTATTFTVQADGAASMPGFRYTIDQNNTRATPAVHTGWTTSATCWVIKKNGSC